MSQPSFGSRLLTADDFRRIARQRDERPWEIIDIDGRPWLSDGARKYPLPRYKGPMPTRLVERLVAYFGLSRYRLDFFLDPGPED